MIYLKPIIDKISSLTEKGSSAHETLNSLESDEAILAYLESIGGVNEEDIARAFRGYYGIEKVNLKEVDNSLLKQFQESFLIENKIVPVSYNEETREYVFAISNLADRELRSRVKKMVGSQSRGAVFKFAFEHEIIKHITKGGGEKGHQVLTSEDLGDFEATEWVEGVINRGITLGASDIHIERLKESIQVRYRVDGLLTGKKEYKLTPSEVSNIYVRIKIISQMDIVESRKSQDGRIDDYEFNNRYYDLRVSTVNTIFGEKVVMRVIDKSSDVASFEDLGFTKENKKKVVDMLNNKNGIIYLAGATGSGKTTTLYSMIDHLNSDDVNIYTIEDPVEKTIHNINQIQIDEASGTDYPSVLAALLRQDPNVIVVGEVRNFETAELSVRASLTGHLVITTLHANNALDSLSRLSDMGVEDYLVGASSIGFLSQVLVRKLCSECKVKRESIEVYEEEWIKEIEPDFNYEEEKSKGNYFYEACGCDKCTNGYKGRVAVIEILQIDDELRGMISRGESIEGMRAKLENEGYKTMKEDGIITAKDGITSLVELMSQL